MRFLNAFGPQTTCTNIAFITIAFYNVSSLDNNQLMEQTVKALIISANWVLIKSEIIG